jgi:DNA mismatch repair ATPase MutL
VYALNQSSTPKSTNQQQQQQQKEQKEQNEQKEQTQLKQEQEQPQKKPQKQPQEQPPDPQPQSHAPAPPPWPNSPRHSARKASPSSRARTRPPSSTRPATPVIPASLPVPPWPRVVDDALLLFKWLQSLQLKCINERVSAPRALLSPQECAQLPSEFRSQLGLAQAGAASDSVLPPSPFAFADGHLLCAIVSKLQRSPLSGAVRPPSTGQSQTTRRAVSLHNVELAIDALRNHQRMPLTYLYREPAIAIVQQDAATLRALLLDIRTAFPASWRRPTLMQMHVQT